MGCMWRQLQQAERHVVVAGIEACPAGAAGQQLLNPGCSCPQTGREHTAMQHTGCNTAMK